MTERRLRAEAVPSDTERPAIAPVPDRASMAHIGPRKRPDRGPDARRRSADSKTDRSTLWWGDNLKVLREEIATESVDLVYLDPPFNSKRAYNVLFKSRDGRESSAQLQAFDDTWHWNEATRDALLDLYHTAPLPVRGLMEALHRAIGENDITAYLIMMTQRLVELHRVLRPTGSLYIHCDPTASHYLKIMLDTLFGAQNFRNEIVWKRSQSHNSAKKYGPVHDVILFYTKSSQFVWNDVRVPLSSDYQLSHYSHEEKGRRYKRQDLTGPGTRNGATGLPWRGIDPTTKGRHWMRPPSDLEELDRQGRIYWPAKSGAWPYLKLYLDEAKGMRLQDVWTDIDPVNPVAKERLGYPTQKPIALLERIISASSMPEDVVLDPFCGCGTAVVASERLGRRWVGIDITSLATSVIENRLDELFVESQFQVRGLPENYDEAVELARRDKFQFQWWIAGRIHALPHDGRNKKGADGGIDGVIPFFDDGSGRSKRCIVSVKGGQNVGPSAVRDLLGAVTATDSQAGVLVTLIEPTPAMRRAAAQAGVYQSPLGRNYPRIQLLTVQQILDLQMPDLPWLEAHANRRRRLASAYPEQQRIPM